MEWILMPIILIGITVLLGWVVHIFNMGLIAFFAFLFGIASFFSCIIAPVSYYQGLQDSIEWTSYYNNMITPNSISESETTITIDSNHAATWQIANCMNINSYNSYLASNRYWDKTPIIGWIVYSAPSQLKYVQIGK